VKLQLASDEALPTVTPGCALLNADNYRQFARLSQQEAGG
jgi:hypothetical protein